MERKRTQARWFYSPHTDIELTLRCGKYIPTNGPMPALTRTQVLRRMSAGKATEIWPDAAWRPRSSLHFYGNLQMSKDDSIASLMPCPFDGTA